MSETQHDDPVVERCRAAIREADWDSLVGPLLRYGIWRLRRWPGRHEERVERAKKLMTEAVSRVMLGRRRWKHPGEIPVLRFIKGVMRSVANEWLEEQHGPADDDPECDIAFDETAHSPGPSPKNERDADAPEDDPRLGEIERASAGDADLEAFVVAAMEAGPKREAIADALGWQPDKVSVQRKKLRRRLEPSPPRKPGATS